MDDGGARLEVGVGTSQDRAYQFLEAITSDEEFHRLLRDDPESVLQEYDISVAGAGDLGEPPSPDEFRRILELLWGGVFPPPGKPGPCPWCGWVGVAALVGVRIGVGPRAD